MTLSGSEAKAVLNRLPGLPHSSFDVAVAEAYLLDCAAPNRWLFVRFNRDGSAAVVKLEKPC